MLQKKRKASIGFQLDFEGNAHKEVAWNHIIRRAIAIVGYETNFLATAYNKRVYAQVLALLPAAEKIARKIMGTSDVQVATNYLVETALLPTTEWILPETFTRGLRKVKEELAVEGIKIKYGQRELTADVVTLDGGEEYYSSLEKKFIGAIKKAFRSYNWKVNETYMVRSSVYKNRVVYPDLMCEDLALWIELDGYEYHQGRDKFTADRQRARMAQLEGYYYLPFSGEEISIPNGIENALRVIAAFISKIRGAPRTDF